MDRTLPLRAERAHSLDDADVMTAMRAFGGYLDITPDDFREIYARAFAIARQRLLSSITAADIMSRPVLTVPSSMHVREAIGFLDEHNISGAPVSDDGISPVGLLSETDIARTAGGTAEPTPMHLLRAVLRQEFDPACLDRYVRDIMTSPAVSVRPSATLADMLALVGTRHINRLPVTNAEGRLVGLVSRTDILNTLGSV